MSSAVLLMRRQNVRTLALIISCFTYLLVGAAIFDALESSHEDNQMQFLNATECEWRARYAIDEADFNNITRLILRMKSYRAGTQWKFAGSFYFATTVITTIGYGHSTPQTVLGKIFCMLYAMIGIPLCLIMFHFIGERMNTTISYVIRQIKQRLKSHDQRVSQMHLIFVSSNMVTLILASGAGAFAYYERWTYLDSFYYCFVTMTTIGFGDFVALQKNDSLVEKPEYVAFTLLFILFGLTVVSSAMNLLVLRFLTLNTEDQERDELEAAIAASEALRLEGDVITSRDDDIIRPSSEMWVERLDTNSICSCTCYEAPRPVLRSKLKLKPFSFKFAALRTSQVAATRRRQRYTVIRTPCRVSHLLSVDTSAVTGANWSVPAHLAHKRLSV